jgi:hypothetical protein
MKTKPARPLVAPLNGNEPLFTKQTDLETGVSILRDLNLREFHALKVDGVDRHSTFQFLTWNGENFTWKGVTDLIVETPAYTQACHLLVSSRTGYQKSVVHPDALLGCLTQVYSITKEYPDGIYRPAGHCSAGRFLSSVSGPCLQPTEGGVGVPWTGGSFHSASVSITKAKVGRTPFTPTRIELEDAVNVVLASGLIHRIK